MKILCDMCDKNEASLFCVADEAALCAACDRRVHHANKLAGKHQRFSLHHPPPKQAPLCDICQERRAFLFCRQDRAILCRDCDLSIHKANQHTQKHARFLLTGLKLSATSALYSESPENASNVVQNDTVLVSPNKPSTSRTESIPAEPTNSDKTSVMMNGSLAAASSSISDYLIEMLPGWHVEELLDSSFTYNGFCKSGGGNEVLPAWDASGVMSDEKKGVWVPQFDSPSLNQITRNQGAEMGFGAPNLSKEFLANNDVKSGRKWCEDTSFLVPQMSQSSKKFRSLW